MRKEISRRDALKLLTVGGGAFALAAVLPGSAEAAQEGGRSKKEIEKNPLSEGLMAWWTPFLPASEQESIDHVNGLPSKEWGKQWELAVFPRVMMPAEINKDADPNHRYVAREAAVNAYARSKGWINADGTFLSHVQVFSYPVAILSSEADLVAGKDKEFWLNGKIVETDALQLGTYSIAVAPIKTENMVIFTNPGEFGQIRARMIDGVMGGEVALAFSSNKNVDTFEPKANEAVAIHVDGFPGAHVRLTYQVPNEETEDQNDQTKFDTVVINARLAASGHLAVHLPRRPEWYKGNYSPVVVIQVQGINTAEHGEGETVFRMGVDDNSPDKNRVTQDDIAVALKK